jgi:hypothetical protein
MIKPTKITTFLILTLLLLTSVGSAFGVVYCEIGCLSEIHHNNHHTDESHAAFGEDYAVSFDYLLKESDDSCFDYPLELDNGVIKKEIVKCPANIALYLPSERLTNPVSVLLNVYNPYQKPPPEISQTILAHRTVVLLI